jgi:hypothetical protein
MRRSRWLASLLCAYLCMGSQASAQPGPSEPRRLRVVIEAHDELDHALIERVRGQLSDLPVELVVATEGAEGTDLSARARHAQGLAATHRADVALWFAVDEAGGQLLVFLAGADDDPVLVRRLPGVVAPAPSSALLESTALVVRSSLRTLAAGEPLGVELADGRGTTTIELRSGPSTAEAVQPPAVTPERRNASSTRERASPGHEVLLFAGWQAVAAGAPLQHGVLARAVLGYSMLEAAVAVSASLPVTHGDELSYLRLARHSASAGLALRGAFHDLRWSAGARAGVVLLQRATEARTEELGARPSRTSPAFSVGPALAMSWMPGVLGLGLELGLDVLPDPPRLVYAQGDDRMLAFRPWVLEPRAVLGVEARIP